MLTRITRRSRICGNGRRARTIVTQNQHEETSCGHLPWKRAGRRGILQQLQHPLLRRRGSFTRYAARYLEATRPVQTRHAAQLAEPPSRRDSARSAESDLGICRAAPMAKALQACAPRKSERLAEFSGYFSDSEQSSLHISRTHYGQRWACNSLRLRYNWRHDKLGAPHRSVRTERRRLLRRKWIHRRHSKKRGRGYGGCT